MLKPGQVVVGRSDIDHLVLWESIEDSSESVECSDSNDLFVIIEVVEKLPSIESENMTDEWKNGAYRVMSSKGNCGWVGEGWVTLAF